MYKNTKIIELDVDGKNIIISLPNQYKKVENTNILDLAIDKMYEQTRIMLGFAPEEYEIEKIKSLGRCENRKITIHPEIVKYRREIIDYIVLHQYCHLKYKTHSKSFYKLIEKYEPNYKRCEEELLNI